MSERNQQLAVRMAWTGRVISLVAALLFLVMLIGSSVVDDIDESPETITIESILLGVIAVIALAGSVISWWREWFAAALLIFTSIALAVHIGVVAGHNHVLAWVVLGLPYLIAGALLLSSWWLSKRG